MKDIDEESIGKSFAVLIIDENNKRVSYSFYSENKKKDAIRKYNSEENDVGNNVLLVQMDDIKNIKNAYPNYLIDTSEFLRKFDTYTKATYWTNPVPPRG